MFVEAREVFGIVGGFGAAVNGKGGGQAGGGSKMVDKAEPNVGCDTPEKDGEEEGAAAEVEAVVGDRVEEKQVSEDHGFACKEALFYKEEKIVFVDCLGGGFCCKCDAIILG